MNFATRLPEVLALKYGSLSSAGWSPRLRAAFSYITPDDWYEAMVFDLVTPETWWLDVGCGRAVFPANAGAATALAARCQRLIGIDPSDNVYENDVVHERVNTSLERYHPDRQFDLVTLRMVVEHIEDPPAAIEALARLTAPGGRVVVYTVDKWSPASKVAAMTSLRVHHAAKRVLWRTEERDTFPTVYRMNTRRTLARLFSGAGFREESFQRLDDCRAFARWWITSAGELALWRLLRGVGLPYPEACLLGTYRKSGEERAHP